MVTRELENRLVLIWSLTKSIRSERKTQKKFFISLNLPETSFLLFHVYNIVIACTKKLQKEAVTEVTWHTKESN